MQTQPITIKVEREAAQFYSSIEEAKRKAIEQFFSSMLKDSFSLTPQTHIEFVRQISKEAKENGMTEEVLFTL